MDCEFTISPDTNTATASPTHPIFAPPPLKDPSSAPSRLQHCTYALQNPRFHDGHGLGFSHDPAIWMLRASLLVSLGYPELAASDAHKARVLVFGALEILRSGAQRNSSSENDLHSDNAGLKALITFSFFLLTNFHTQWDPALRTSWTESSEPITSSNLREATLHHLSLVDQQIHIILIISLQHCNAFAENLELCEQAAKRFGQAGEHPFWGKETRSKLKDLLQEKQKEAEAHPAFSGSKLDVEDAVRGGGVLACRYPWMGEDFTERMSILEGINEELGQASEGKCWVGHSDITAKANANVPQSGRNGEVTSGPDDAGTNDAAARVRGSREESLGVFAKVDIPSSTTLFTETRHCTSITSDPKRCPVCCGPLFSGVAEPANTKSRQQGLSIGPHHSRAPYPLPCCDQTFCSRQCGEIALSTFHKPLCGKTFSFPSDIGLSPARLQHSRRSRHTAAYLLQRILALAVQGMMPALKDSEKAGEKPNTGQSNSHKQQTLAHPLQHPIIKRLTVNYHFSSSDNGETQQDRLAPSSARQPWSFTDSVIYPQEMLEKMGIDPYGDLRFDGWVLRTIALRISNNQHGGLVHSNPADTPDGDRDAEEGAAYVQALHPLFVFFNHSCEPNVSYGDHSVPETASETSTTNTNQLGPTTSRLVAATNTAITAGTELCISYLDVSSLEGRPHQRGKALATWFGEGGCGCEMCAREREELSGPRDDEVTGSVERLNIKG